MYTMFFSVCRYTEIEAVVMPIDDGHTYSKAPRTIKYVIFV
jgi:hypothetical protein